MVAVGFLPKYSGPVMRPGQMVTSFNPLSFAIFHAAFSALSLPTAYQSCVYILINSINISQNKQKQNHGQILEAMNVDLVADA